MGMSNISSQTARVAALLLLLPMSSWAAVLSFGTPVDIGGGQVEVALNLKLEPGETLKANAMDAFFNIEPVVPINLTSGANYTDGFFPPLTTDHATFSFFLAPITGKPLTDGPVLFWTFDKTSNAPSLTKRFVAELDVENLADPIHPTVLLADSAPPVPEPSPSLLLFTGLGALGFWRLTKRI